MPRSHIFSQKFLHFQNLCLPLQLILKARTWQGIAEASVYVPVSKKGSWLLTPRCGTSVPRQSREGGSLYLGKALLDALFLTFWNLAVPHTFVKQQSNNDAHEYVIFTDSSQSFLAYTICRIYTYDVGFGVALPRLYYV